jgi:hypothetical protein
MNSVYLRYFITVVEGCLTLPHWTPRTETAPQAFSVSQVARNPAHSKSRSENEQMDTEILSTALGHYLDMDTPAHHTF